MNTNNTEIIKTITASLAEIIEQLKKLDTPAVPKLRSIITIQCTDKRGTCISDYCAKLFNKPSVTVDMTNEEFWDIVNKPDTYENVRNILRLERNDTHEEKYNELLKQALKICERDIQPEIDFLNGKSNIFSGNQLATVAKYCDANIDDRYNQFTDDMIKYGVTADTIRKFVRSKIDQKFLDLIA